MVETNSKWLRRLEIWKKRIVGEKRCKFDYGVWYFWVFLVICMKIISWNIRGLGRSEKKRAVRRLCLKEKLSMALIQESKL